MNYKKSLPLLLIAALAGALWNEFGAQLTAADISRTTAVTGNAALEAAFRDKRSDLQIQGEGKVIAVLPDDNKGSRHQRFLLELDSGITLLVAHNIDLAPRIPDLARGDTVGFYGEYEWNAKGGVIHWTHHDPRGKHPDGWLQHSGARFD